MSKNTWENEVCDACHKPFDFMAWIDRHEDNAGTDAFPVMTYFHQECCPSCATTSPSEYDIPMFLMNDEDWSEE